jgi:FtsP/CotA-like multicopper oxidase with cupredoxin domain
VKSSRENPVPIKRKFLGSAIAVAGYGLLAVRFSHAQTAVRPPVVQKKKQNGGKQEDSKNGAATNDDQKKVGKTPATTPFVTPLPVYRPKQSVAKLSPAPQKTAGKDECGRDPHQGWDHWLPTKFYEIRVREEDHEFHPELPRQPIWGYDGKYPGPTIVTRQGEPMLLRIYNDLREDHVGFGSPEISTHVHNAHAASESDGFPGDWFSRDKWGPTLTRGGKYRDHHFANCYSNYAAYDTTNGDPTEGLGTMWYHDHRIDFTAANVYRGLAGFFLMFDELDSGNEADPHTNALRLPSGIGEYDIPLMFQDRKFDSAGYLFFDQFDAQGALGDKFLVNGKIQPYFEVERRKYRFRMLNASGLRFYEFYLVFEGKDQSFKYIASDGNLLPASLDATKVNLAMAERADIVVDFKKYPAGSKLYLVNRLEQIDERGPSGRILTPGTQILRFDVAGDPSRPDVSQVPTLLRPLRPVDLKSVVRTRRWEFDRENDVWTVNGKIFDVSKPSAFIKRGQPEIWILQGKGSWHHPVHIHLEEARILSRNGLPPPPHERGRKDVFVLHPGEEVRVYICFTDFLGKYIMHCHNTVHEDHHMMVRFDVVP